MKVIWPSNIFGRQDPADSWDYIASLLSPLLLPCSCFMYMRTQLMYMYLVVNSSLTQHHSIWLHPPPSPFTSEGCIMSYHPFVCSFMYFNAEPSRASKIFKRLPMALFRRQPELYLRSTQVPDMGQKCVTEAWWVWRVTQPGVDCDSLMLYWGIMSFLLQSWLFLMYIFLCTFLQIKTMKVQPFCLFPWPIDLVSHNCI